jgi:RNA polymerase sigma-70 factor (ECF subfamily)
MADGSVALTSPTLLGALWDPTNEGAWRTFLQRYQPLIDNWGSLLGSSKSNRSR